MHSITLSEFCLYKQRRPEACTILQQCHYLPVYFQTDTLTAPFCLKNWKNKNYFSNLKPDRDSNLHMGPSEYRSAALLTKLSGRLQTTSPPLIREQFNTTGENHTVRNPNKQDGRRSQKVGFSLFISEIRDVLM
jgi:hypothetical protein